MSVPVSAAAGVGAGGSRPAAERFPGAWTLVSWKIERSDGEIIDSPLGRDPLGWIMYHPAGRMSVVIMRPDRPKFASDNLLEAAPESLLDDAGGAYAHLRPPGRRGHPPAHRASHAGGVSAELAAGGGGASATKGKE